MSDTPETDAQLTTFTSVSKLKKHFVNRTGSVSAEFARKLERERNAALAALHQCYAATGEDAGDMGDFRALVDREKHAVNAVREMREELDRLTAEYRDSKD